MTIALLNRATLLALSTAAQVGGQCQLWTALEDLKAVDPLDIVLLPGEAREVISRLKGVLRNSSCEEKSTKATVMTMATLQGLCPVETWDKWRAINGC